MIRFLMSTPGFEPEGGGSNTMALASAVLGGVALVGTACCCVPILNCFAQILVPILSIAAVVTGILGISKANELGGTGKGLAFAGIGLGVGALFVGVIVVVVSQIVGVGAMALLDEL